MSLTANEAFQVVQLVPAALSNKTKFSPLSVDFQTPELDALYKQSGQS